MRQLERVTAGSEQLDDILHGGIPRGSVVFVAGLPGTGKTILCQQAIWANSLKMDKVLYLSTLAEPMAKMLRFAQAFSFFRANAIGESVVYSDLGTALTEGPVAVFTDLDRLVREHRPELLVIDSFRAIRDFFTDRAEFRKFASQLMIRLNTWEVTSLFIGEYNEEDIRREPEFSIADGIIYLFGTEDSQRQRRLMRIMKMRGTDFFAGEHAFQINGDGIRVYPRMNPNVVGDYKVSTKRVGSAIAGLGKMLGGGIFEGTSTLILGVTGAGKTLTALSFLVQGAKKKMPGLLVTLEESPLQVVRNSQSFGWDSGKLMDEGLIQMFHVSPSELDIDMHATVIKERADAMKAKFVAIDSISGFESSIPDVAKYQSYLWAINDYFKRMGVTVIMTSESAGFFEALDYAPRHVSLFSDNIILLRSFEVAGEMKRVINIPKMRGSQHDHFARELKIRVPEISVGEEFRLVGVPDGGEKR